MNVDVQHDFLEGIIPYDLALLINHFINTEKKFTLTQLNILIQSFPFDKNVKNKPAEIRQIHLKDKRLQMLAAEMLPDCTRTRLHTDPIAHGPDCARPDCTRTCLHTDPIAHGPDCARPDCTPTRLRTNPITHDPIAHGPVCTPTRLHTDPFAHRPDCSRTQSDISIRNKNFQFLYFIKRTFLLTRLIQKNSVFRR
ncbi:hypothetical protein ALC57_09258 [Trachymyrmex cornetzi]|uniref:Uncharacterized protein n=1 Tax=Trachymyrmex cornetzi TaxID=471704 RepID=A0A151J5N3_9HYME|nr:hypothetical protein ALC57_09258 [Trachymyrmex cornetzi]